MSAPLSALRPPITSRRQSPPVVWRPAASLALATLGLILVAVALAMPWLSVFHGLQAISGFRMGGGDLGGVAVVSAVALGVGARCGDGRALRPLALVGALVVLAGALRSAYRLAGYATAPGPAATLIAPVAGPGPLVLAAAGVALLAAALLAPMRPVAMSRDLRLTLILAAATFVAGWMHLLLAPEHLAEFTLLGVGFLSAGMLQVATALVIVLRPSVRVLPFAVVLDVALLVVWTYSVLVGLPLTTGSEHEVATGLVIGKGEPVDLPAVITEAAQLVSLTLALVLLRRPPPQEAQMGLT